MAQPIDDTDQKTSLGVIAVDMSLARLTELNRSTRVSDNAVTCLVDAQGLMVAPEQNFTHQVTRARLWVLVARLVARRLSSQFRLAKHRAASSSVGAGIKAAQASVP